MSDTLSFGVTPLRHRLRAIFRASGVLELAI
jgi:hypothetical protein